MKELDEFLKRIDAFAQKHKTRPDLVMRAFTGNPRAYKRIQRRAREIKQLVRSGDIYMEKKNAGD